MQNNHPFRLVCRPQEGRLSWRILPSTHYKGFCAGVRPGWSYRDRPSRMVLPGALFFSNLAEQSDIVYPRNSAGRAARRSLKVDCTRGRVGARLSGGSRRGSSPCSTRGEEGMELPQTMQIGSDAISWRLGPRLQAARSIDGLSTRYLAPGVVTTARKWLR